jgi:uncharacterized protein YndB with AHSA1/START domain
MPSAPAMRLTSDRDTLITEIDIAAPPERVFESLVDPQQVLQWWGQAGMYRCTEFKADLRPGGEWLSTGPGPDGSNFKVTGEYLEIDPPRLLAYTWVASWTGNAKTTVRWELEPTESGTRIRLLHRGLAADPKLAESYRGWPQILGWIRAFVERGETIDTRK